jgi:hypothetical protein
LIEQKKRTREKKKGYSTEGNNKMAASDARLQMQNHQSLIELHGGSRLIGNRG